MANTKQIEKDLTAAQRLVERLTGDLAKAQAFYEGTVEARRAVLLDEAADQRAINNAGAKADSAARNLDAVRDALQIAKSRAAESEAKLADARAQANREQRTQELRQQAAKVDAAWTALEPRLAELLGALQEAAAVPDAARWAAEIAGFREAMSFGIVSVKSAFEGSAVAELQGASEQTEGARVVGLFRAAIGVR
jgi:chromosome segregation ATPase